MKRLLLCTASLALLISASLHAQTSAQPNAQTATQSIVGTWQGTLTVGANSTRIVFALQKATDASLHGGFKWIDRGDGSLLDSVTLSAADVTFAQPLNALTFHGKLSADGKTIDGALTQYTQSFPLTLTLATPDTLWKREGPAALPPMAADADPAFEVATIKPRAQVEHGTFFDLTAHPFTAQDASASELIKMGWNIRGRQVIGGPPWVRQDAYDVTGVPDTPGKPSEDQGRLMVRKLLAERFHLVAHTDQQPYSVFAFTLDPKGPALTPSNPEFNGHGNINVRQDKDDILYQFSGVTMAQFIYTMMNRFRDRQLVDETGLTGVYDITLRLPSNAFQGGPATGEGGAEDELGPAFLAAAAKAGFKITAKKEPILVVVIDHIDPPTPN